MTKLSITLGLLVCLCSLKSVAQKNNPLIDSKKIIEEGSKLHDEEKYKQAIAIFDKANPNDTNFKLVLYEKAYSLYADSQYTKAIQLAKQGFEKYPEYNKLYASLLGNIYDDAKQPEEALKIYNLGLQRSPHLDVLYLNKGVTLKRIEKVAEGEAVFHQGALVNPNYASFHYHIGLTYMQKGNLVPAMMAFATYLAVAPEGRWVKNCVQFLQSIAKADETLTEYTAKYKDEGKDDFKEVEEIVWSKIALSTKYKVPCDLEDPIVNQLYVICEKASYSEKDKGFAMQYYLPFFKSLLKDKTFEAFVFSIFSGLEIEKINTWNKKNKSATEKMGNGFRAHFTEIKATRELDPTKREGIKRRYVYSDGKLAGIGELKEIGKEFKLLGDWEFFNDDLVLTSKGAFNNDGKKQGPWIFYYDNGKEKERITYANGEKEGKAFGLHENGQKWYTQNFKNGELEGEELVYYFSGIIKSKYNYIAGKENGPAELYSYRGIVKEKLNFVNGLKSGPFTTYKNGYKENEGNYENGEITGIYKTYYSNGQIESTGDTKKGTADGEWKYYYRSGKLHYAETFDNGDTKGELVKYYENGKVSSKLTISKKKLNGPVEYFDTDGVLYSKAIYAKGKPKKVEYYDKKGNVYYEVDFGKGANELANYSPNGTKTSFGSFTKAGDKIDKHNDYYPNGTLKSEAWYQNDQRNGKTITYYKNGKKYFETTYKDDKEEGYSLTYHPNGNLKLEGNVVEGNKQQVFYGYDLMGNLESEGFYLNDEEVGVSKNFTPNKKLQYEYEYNGEGWLIGIRQYDTTGKLLTNVDISTGNSPYVLKHQNGKTLVEGTYANTYLNGPYKVYFPDGTLNKTMTYKYGMLDGEYLVYNLDKKKTTEGKYNLGVKVGTWKYYYDNGTLKDEEQYDEDGNLHGDNNLFYPNGDKERLLKYKNGDLHGETTIYCENNIAAVLFYEDGVLLGYSYEGKEGKLVPMIKLKDGNGKIEAFYKSGTKSYTTNYVNNEVDGPRIIYYGNGKVFTEATRIMGYDNGVKKMFSPTGQLLKESNFVYGNYHGKTTEYYPNGKIKAEEVYHNDDLHGTSTYYNEQGKVTRTVINYYGVMTSVK